MDPPVINLSDFGTRKEEITAQLMDAAKSLGKCVSCGFVCVSRVQICLLL